MENKENGNPGTEIFREVRERLSLIARALCGSEEHNRVAGDIRLLVQRERRNDWILAIAMGVIASVLSSAITILILGG